ncbi:MAG: YceI family protein [Geodermatophilaceae bacterium]|nr:YceI family protein [Geodermatophilaceae bacterium]
MPPFSGSSAAVLQRAVGTWNLAGPTMAGFSVGNLGKRISGTMPVASAHFEVSEDGRVRDVRAVLDIASIDTGLAKRDSDLRKPGLLDLDNYPQLTFSATTDVVALEDRWSVNGLLTVKGTTREITLAVTVEQPSEDTARIHLTGHLDRRHYGIRAPRFMIGALVDIEIEAKFSR